MKDELRKILQDLFASGVAWIPSGKSEKWIDISVDEAETAILELFNKQLPKKITTVVIPDFPESRLFAEAYSKGQAVGYNQCLKDIRRAAGLEE